jgi:hypothetical protein
LEDYPEQNKKFLDENGIQLLQFGVAGNKVCNCCIWDMAADIAQGTFCGYSRRHYMLCLGSTLGSSQPPNSDSLQQGKGDLILIFLTFALTASHTISIEQVASSAACASCSTGLTHPFSTNIDGFLIPSRGPWTSSLLSCLKQIRRGPK